MSDTTRHGSGDGAEVIDLECARFEDALAQGNLSERSRAHLQTCVRCGVLKGEMESMAALIAEVTGPREVDASFEQGVMDRVREMTFDLEPNKAPPSQTASGIFRPVSLALAAAAALTLAYWAGGERFATEAEEPAPVAMKAAPPERAFEPEPPQIPTGPAGGAVVMVPRVQSPSADRPTPIAHRPVTETIPEPMVDLPSEIREALVRYIKTQESCPDKASRAVRLTVTVEATGAITNRQILSSADASDAHRCVTRAVDSLLLPPMPEPATLTLDVSW